MKRRDFLSVTGTFTGGLLVLPNLMHAAAQKLRNGQTSSRVVFLQLNGGNDGLNTVVPYSDPLYYELRKKVSIEASEVLKFNGQLGWHPSLKGLAEIQQRGHLSVLQNVGYPNPIRSHFRSQEIWQTASSSSDYLERGWLGRYLDLHCKDQDPTAAVNIDKADNLALSGDRLNSITIPNPQGYKVKPGGEAYEEHSDNPQLDFVRRIARSTTQVLKRSNGRYRKHQKGRPTLQRWWARTCNG